jgi:hypothetical protein
LPSLADGQKPMRLYIITYNIVYWVNEMKNNGIVQISNTTIGSLCNDLKSIPDMVMGIEYINAALENIGLPSNVIGGIGYDYKAIYAYVIDPAITDMTISEKTTHIGAFIRYDDIRKMMVIRAIVYVDGNQVPLIFDQMIGKTVIRELDKIELSMGGIIEKYRACITEIYENIMKSLKMMQRGG